MPRVVLLSYGRCIHGSHHHRTVAGGITARRIFVVSPFLRQEEEKCSGFMASGKDDGGSIDISSTEATAGDRTNGDSSTNRSARLRNRSKHPSFPFFARPELAITFEMEGWVGFRHDLVSNMFIVRHASLFFTRTHRRLPYTAKGSDSDFGFLSGIVFWNQAGKKLEPP